MQSVAVFVDVQNIYYTTKHSYQRHFNYRAFWDAVTANRNVVAAFAYAIDKGDWDVGITLDVIEYAAQVDVIVLVSGDGDFALLLDKARHSYPVETEVYGVAKLTAPALMNAASRFIAIDDSLLL